MKKKLTRDKIITAAFAFADKHGLAELSMRNLAETLGVKAMSLYNHIDNKDQIIHEITDKAVGEIYLPKEDANWRKEIEKRCHSAYRVLRCHQWLTHQLLTGVNSGIQNLRYFDQTLATFNNAGFTLPEADYAINAMDSFIYGFTSIENHFPFKPEEYASAAKEYAPLIKEYGLPALYELNMAIANKKHKGVQSFDYGLKLLLDSLERQLNDNKA